MADKYIVTYTDNSHGKSETGLTKEWSFEKDASATIEKDTKKLIWEWKKETGVEIKKVERYSSKENITFDDKLGGEF